MIDRMMMSFLKRLKDLLGGGEALSLSCPPKTACQCPLSAPFAA